MPYFDIPNASSMVVPDPAYVAEECIDALLLDIEVICLVPAVYGTWLRAGEVAADQLLPCASVEI